MYESFYNLSANPFRLTPDPNFCFAHASHSQARAYLEYALKLGEGLIMVTGRPGTGKTTLIESFIKELEMSEVLAERIAASNLDAENLLRAVAYAYGIDAEGLDKATLRRCIKQHFNQQVRSGKRVLLIIDEAQGLAHPALEELRLLADLQSGSRPLLQLFLVGQDSLRDLMRLPEMEQFQQRVIGTCFLEPLNLKDTRGYVEHRLRQADWKSDPQMTGAAIVSIYQHSQGVPRHINKTCTRLLLHGLLKGKHELDEADVLTIAAELRDEQLAPLVSNQEESPGVTKRMPVPELEDGSLTVAELALRADGEEAGRPVTPVHSATRVVRRPAAHQAPRRPAAMRRAPSATLPRQMKRPVKKQPTWWSDTVELGHAFQRYGIETAKVLKDQVQALGHALQRYGIEIARLLEDRLQGQGGFAVKIGALVVVALSIAVLTTPSEDDPSDQNAALAVHSEVTDLLPAPSVDRESMNTLELESSRHDPLWHNTESSPVVIVKKKVSEDLAAGASTAIQADNVARQPELEFTATPVPEPARPKSEPRQVTMTSNIATDAAAMDEREREQKNVSNERVLESVSPMQAGDVLSQDVAAVDEAVAGSASVTDMDNVRDSEEMEVAALVPVVKNTPLKPVSADDDAITSPVTVRQKIDELLSLGRQALSEDRLLIPSNNNAYHYYQQVLILESDNADANDGVEQIVQRYVLFTRRALEIEDEEKARRYIDRGLRVRPKDQRLLALQEQMDKRLARLEPPEETQVFNSPPPQVADEPAAPEPQDFMSRLKEFFSKGQSESQENSLWVE